MEVLRIDNETLHDAKKVIEYAKRHIMDIHQIKLVIAGDLSQAGHDPGHVLYIDKDFRVVFSIEKQSIGLCNHISVSKENRKNYPSPHAVLEILKIFDMEKDFKNSLGIWEEKK